MHRRGVGNVAGYIRKDLNKYEKGGDTPPPLLTYTYYVSPLYIPCFSAIHVVFSSCFICLYLSMNSNIHSFLNVVLYGDYFCW